MNHEHEEAITHYLQAFRDMRTPGAGVADFRYKGPESYLLDKGRFWTPQPLPPGVSKMRAKECFRNAIRLLVMRTDLDLRYCEGYATTHTLGIPLHHGWCVTPIGNVVDPTWKDGAAYYGVAYTFNESFPALEASGSVLHDYKNGFPVLKTGEPLIRSVKRRATRRSGVSA
jgi:hypothetical protein